MMVMFINMVGSGLGALCNPDGFALPRGSVGLTTTLGFRPKEDRKLEEMSGCTDGLVSTVSPEAFVTLGPSAF